MFLQLLAVFHFSAFFVICLQQDKREKRTTIKGRMILGWSFYAIERLRPPIASCQSFPFGLSSLPFGWMELHLSMILLWEDSPIPATGNSFTQSDGFTWVHIRREHFLTSMILFRMASKPIT